MRSILSNFKLVSHQAARPPVAVEIAAGGVFAAVLPAPGREPVFASQTLPPDVLMPGIGEPNLRKVETVVAAIRTTLKEVSPQTRAVTLVLPDLCVRVFLLDFDSLPRDDASALPILRFRLRKVVPFDLERAKLSYQVLSKDQTGCRVLVAVIPGPILEEYESAVLAADYEPGAVLSSGLAALAALDSVDPELTACIGDRSLTTAITKGNEVLLYRTLDLAADPDLRFAEAQRDVAVAAAYFEDRLASRPQRLRYTGFGTTEEFASAIAGPEMAAVALLPRHQTETAAPQLANTCFAGVVGALAGAK